MNWNTIYIKGRPGFEAEVTDKLTDSAIRIMPGSFTEGENKALYWIEENTSVRELKKAIGSKLVFKYRLQFFKSLEELQASENLKKESFTIEEEEQIKKMHLGIMELSVTEIVLN